MRSLFGARARGVRSAILALVILPMIGGQAFAMPSDDKAAAWAKALPRIQRAERESLDAIDEAAGEIRRHFDTAAPKIRPWVVDLLGLWGKLDFIVGGGQKMVNGVSWLVDGVLGTQFGQIAGKDQFEENARKTFAEKVLDPAEVKHAIEAATSRFDARLEAIQAKLYVELEADIDDLDIKPAPIPAVHLSDAIILHIDAAMNDAIFDAGADFLLTVGKEVAGQFIQTGLTTAFMGGGGAAAGYGAANTGDPLTDAAITAAGFVGGFVIGYGLDKLQEFAGHDPVGLLAGKIGKRLVSARDALVEGEENTTKAYPIWISLSLMHPEYQVRSFARQAASAIEPRNALGLRGHLMAARWKRIFAQRTAIWKSIYGEQAMPDAESFQNLLPNQSSQTLINIARTWFEQKGK